MNNESCCLICHGLSPHVLLVFESDLFISYVIVVTPLLPPPSPSLYTHTNWNFENNSFNYFYPEQHQLIKR